MSGTFLFSGNAFSVADSKGRFVLPLDMRKVIRASSGDETRLCASIHEAHGCAIGFGLSHKFQLEEEIQERAAAHLARGEDFDADGAREAAFSSMEEANFDDGGRFFLPTDIKDFCEIEDVILFVGVSRYIQMWNPATYLKSEGRPELVKAKVRKFLAEREGARK